MTHDTLVVVGGGGGERGTMKHDTLMGGTSWRLVIVKTMTLNHDMFELGEQLIIGRDYERIIELNNISSEVHKSVK